MAIDQTDKVDFISIDEKGESVVLTISDHLDWSDIHYHLFLLQEKINSYISFYESGQIFENYPLAKGKNVVFSIVAKEDLPEEANDFFQKMKAFLLEIDLDLRFEVIK